MKKILTQTLLKSLLTSDFLILEREHLKAKENDFRHKNLNFYAISCLEPLEVISSWKQLVRIFQFYKKYNTSKNKELHFFLDSENTTLISFIKVFLSTKSISSQVACSINSNLQHSKRVGSRQGLNIGFILDSQIFADKNFLKKQLNKNLFLLFQIDSKIQHMLNLYKIQNNLLDYKKTLFLLSFLRQLVLTIYNKT